MSSYNVYELLKGLISRTSEAAGKLDVSQTSMFIAGAALALIIGLIGYRLIKVIMGIAIGAVGYFAGVELFVYLQENTSVIAKAPDWIGYVIGAILAVVFMSLGFSKFSYAMFAMFALIGYNFTAYYLPDRALLAVAGAVVLALLSTLVVRFSFIVISSAIGGFAGVMYLGELIPKANFLQLGEQKAAFWVAAGVTLFFILFQYATRNRKSGSLY